MEEERNVVQQLVVLEDVERRCIPGIACLT